MDIRIIYDYNLSKLNKQYQYISNIFPKHELIIYKKKYDIVFNKSKYNIYLDMISEFQYNAFPSECHILVVNDEYVLTNQFVRRESFIDKPLILQNEYIDYFFCLTKYSYNILLSNGINFKKLLLLNALIEIPIKLNIPKQKNKYIYYEIDFYSMQDNSIILFIWNKYFLNRPEKLIIKYIYSREIIINNFSIISGIKIEKGNIYTYKNIIIIDNDKHLSKYINDIVLVIINHSNFNLIYTIFNNILNNKYIITIKNDISTNILHKNNILFNEPSQNQIYNCLQTYFNSSNQIINNVLVYNKNNLLNNIKKTHNILNKFFS